MGLSVTFIRVDIHSGLIHVVLTYMHRSGTKESSGGPTKQSMQKAEYGLRRVLLLGTSVNRGITKDRSCYEPRSL